MNFFTRLAVRRGILGGNKYFASIAVVIGLVRMLQRLSGSGPKTLYTHKLADGESLVITNPARAPRSRRRWARR